MSENPYPFKHPKDQAVEQAVLGCLIIEPALFHEHSYELHEGLFWWKAHKTIYRALESLFQRKIFWDIIVLGNELEVAGSLEDSGGRYYLTELVNRATVTVSFKHHVEILRSLAIRRAVIDASLHAASIATQGGESITEIASAAENAILIATRPALPQTSKNYLEEAFTRYCNERDGHKYGYTSGFVDIDRVTGQFEPGELIIVAARPGVGKTLLGALMAYKQAVSGIKTGFISLEMYPAKIMIRLVQYISGLTLYEMRHNESARQTVMQAFNKLHLVYNKMMLVEECPANTADVVALARRMFVKDGCQVVFIDHFHHINDNTQESVNAMRNASLAKIWSICHDHRIDPRPCIVLLAQINREAETGRRDNRPQLYHLKDTSELEQKADIVIGLYRPSLYKDETEETKDDTLEVTVLKNRNRGGVGERVTLGFDPKRQTIYDAESPPPPPPPSLASSPTKLDI